MNKIQKERCSVCNGKMETLCVKEWTLRDEKRFSAGMKQGKKLGEASQMKEELKWLETLQNILAYKSEIPLVEIGRENLTNDIENELNLTKRIAKFKRQLK